MNSAINFGSFRSIDFKWMFLSWLFIPLTTLFKELRLENFNIQINCIFQHNFLSIWKLSSANNNDHAKI